jgi:hypothetical protein
MSMKDKKIIYVHSGALKYASRTMTFHAFLKKFKQNIVNDRNITLGKKIELVSLNDDHSLNEIKVLCKT